MPLPPQPEEHPVLVWAMTRTGEMVSTFFKDLEEAEKFGRINVSSGAWRTWDAFELPPDLNATRRVLVGSHDKSKKVSMPSHGPAKVRPRILANWTPPPGAAGTNGHGAAGAREMVRPHARTRVMVDWKPSPLVNGSVSAGAVPSPTMDGKVNAAAESAGTAVPVVPLTPPVPKKRPRIIPE